MLMMTGAPSPTMIGSEAASRSRGAAPTAPTPAADEKLIPAKAVEAEAIEAIEAEAVKPVRAEAVEAETASLEAPVEAARRKMRKMTAPKSRATDRPAHSGGRRREAEGEDERRRGAGARSPSSQGKYAWEGLRRRNVKSNSNARDVDGPSRFIAPGLYLTTVSLRAALRQAGIKPARPVLAEGETFIEQHDVVPLRPLSLVDGQRVAVVELVRLPSQSKAEFPLRPLEERLQYGDLDRRARALVFRAQSHLDEVFFDAAQRLNPPKAAIDEALGAVIPQADQPVPCDGQRLPETLEIPHALIVGAAGAVCPRPAPDRRRAPEPDRRRRAG